MQWSAPKILCVAVFAIALGMQASSAPSNPLAESLGLLLGLPLDADVPPQDANPPEFLMDLYECMSESDGRIANCLPDAADEGLENVDVVRSFVGTVVNPPTAVHSYNRERELSNAMALVFNTSCTTRHEETLRATEFRIFRDALSEEQIAGLESRCDLSQLQLELYLTLDSNDVVVLEKITSVSREALGESEWIVFRNLTKSQMKWVKCNRSNNMFSLRLAVGGRCTDIHPSELGLTARAGRRALITGFSESEVNRRLAMSHAGDTNHRAKRETQPINLDNSCRLYPHTVNFTTLGWEGYVKNPSTYTANFCAGTCRYPLSERFNTTKHSYIQSIGHHENPELIPSPCCIPTNYSSLLVLLQVEPTVFLYDTWTEMIATECGCR